MIDVTCAIIRNDDELVLVVRRPDNSDHPGKWEFPGGKVRDGEEYEECIAREIREELSMEIVICRSLKPVVHDYGFKKIRLVPFVCDTLEERPLLTEHTEFRWVEAESLSGIDFSEADIPVAREYMQITGGAGEAGSKGAEAVIPAPESESRLSGEIEKGIREMLGDTAGFGSVHLLAESAAVDDRYINSLMAFSTGNDERLAFRSSYTLVKLTEKNPAAILPWLGRLAAHLPGLTSEQVTRSFLKILTLTGIERLGEKEKGIVVESCFGMLNSGNSSIAVKAYSMELLYYLALSYPALAPELVASIQRNMEGGSAGIIARGQQILRKIYKADLLEG